MDYLAYLLDRAVGTGLLRGEVPEEEGPPALACRRGADGHPGEVWRLPVIDRARSGVVASMLLP